MLSPDLPTQQKLIIACFHVCRAKGLATSRRNVDAIIRLVNQGASFRASVIANTLNEYVERVRNKTGIDLEPPTEHKSAVNGTAPEPAIINLELSRSTTSHDTAKKAGGVRNRKLPLDIDVFSKRRALLKPIWEQLQPHVNRSTTWTRWSGQNAKTADSLVAAGRTPEEVLEVWVALSRERGPIIWLSQVQNAMAKADVSRSEIEPDLELADQSFVTTMQQRGEA